MEWIYVYTYLYSSGPPVEAIEFYVSPNPENKYYEIPQPKANARNFISSPRIPKIFINVHPIFGRMYFYIHSSTEDKRLLVYWI